MAQPLEQAVQVLAVAPLKYPSLQAVQALASAAAVQVLQPVEQAVQVLAATSLKYPSMQAVQAVLDVSQVLQPVEQAVQVFAPES